MLNRLGGLDEVLWWQGEIYASYTFVERLYFALAHSNFGIFSESHANFHGSIVCIMLFVE